jgi:hypothetical protein
MLGSPLPAPGSRLPAPPLPLYGFPVFDFVESAALA